MLAKEIWEQHYTPIIGASQVEYMLSKFQSFENISNEIATAKMLYYIIYLGVNTAGYCAIKPEDNRIFLSKLYIKKDYRGSSLGKNMIRYIINNFSGNEYVYLTVNKHNTNSINAYKKMGFTISGSVASDIGDGYIMDDYIMKLSIANQIKGYN